MNTPPNYLIWASDLVHRRHGDEHRLVIGASGSGKSTIINLALQTVISDPSVRALVYDPKQELVPFLYGLRGFAWQQGVLHSSVKILHPFDVRAVAWDMALDIYSPISARQLATILVPDAETSPGTDGFFTSAVRDILTGVLLAFIRCSPNPNAWTFRDVLLALLYEPYREFLLSLQTDRDERPFPLLQRLQSSYFGPHADARTKANIQATLNAKMAVFEPVAAAWHAAEKAMGKAGTFSLSAWLSETPQSGQSGGQLGNQSGAQSVGQQGSVLVLGNDEAARSALDPINQALFKRATELVLARRERTKAERDGGENQIWFFLDEVREAGRLDGLSRLLTKGRSKNVCVVMGFQDMDGMRDVYGDEVANEICAQFNNIAMLRVNSPATAQWASDMFGRRLEEGANSGITINKQGGLTTSQGKSKEERPFLYTEDFLFGENAAAAKQVSGYRKGPDIRTADLSREDVINEFRFLEATEAPRFSADELMQHLEEQSKQQSGKPLSASERQNSQRLVSAFAARPIKHQFLQPWDREDWQRLGWPDEPPALFPVQDPSAAQKQQDEEEKKREWQRITSIHWVFTEMIEQAAQRVQRGGAGSPRSVAKNSSSAAADPFASDTMRPVDDLNQK